MVASGTKTGSALGELYYGLLDSPDIQQLRELETNFRFTHQQLKQVAQWMVDCRMWEEPDFQAGLEKLLTDQ